MTPYALRLVFVLFAGLLAATVCHAQQPKQVYRIGLLEPGPDTDVLVLKLVDQLRQDLRALGYVDGENTTLEVRWSPPDRPDLLPAIASEMVRSDPDVLIGPTTPIIRALKQATNSIPILMIAPGDPVGTGLIQSLARPGGNVTGMTWMAGELQGKRLELLKEIVPKMSRVAHLWNPENPATIRASKELEVATASLGIVLHSEEVRRADEIVTAFSSMARGRVDALLVTADPLTISNRKRIADLAAQHRLPSMYYMRDYVEDGGLISYGPSLAHQYRRVAGYVDRILKGAKPNELPVEQPNKFELVVNLRTAKVLGVRIPETVLARADEIIR